MNSPIISTQRARNISISYVHAGKILRRVHDTRSYNFHAACWYHEDWLRYTLGGTQCSTLNVSDKKPSPEAAYFVYPRPCLRSILNLWVVRVPTRPGSLRSLLPLLSSRVAYANTKNSFSIFRARKQDAKKMAQDHLRGSQDWSHAETWTRWNTNL